MSSQLVSIPTARTINYLRVSITDRCNLRCCYCMPEDGVPVMPHKEVLSYEEMLRLIGVFVQAGIRKVRITGGEPLVRKDAVDLLGRLHQMPGLEEVTLTTNGVLLKEFAAQLKKSGVSRLNISLDSLKRERFARITRRDRFDDVVAGIHLAESLGFDPIKINVVTMRGVNDDEIGDFYLLAKERPYQIRFIEYMPVGAANSWDPAQFISSKEIYETISQFGRLEPLDAGMLDGPARCYRLVEGAGQIGFISALSDHFCERCNRLRLTADGQLRTCLFSDAEVSLKTPLRQGGSDEELLDLIRRAIKNKPKGHGLQRVRPEACLRQMSRIGG
ncbi:Cyclic pyranopterin monophosphate synthase [uncultured Desulfatiglans sp.]|nr:Cyclic pyranopterin monophosphate synthase [uncultured Desulfatiglans sp.]